MFTVQAIWKLMTINHLAIPRSCLPMKEDKTEEADVRKTSSQSHHLGSESKALTETEIYL